MSTGYLTDYIKITPALAYASGTADRKGATLDMQNWDGVMIVVTLAAIEAAGTNSVRVQHSDTTTDGHFVDIKGTKIDVADDDDDERVVIDIYQPVKRYVRVYIDKDTVKTCAESAEYIQYRGRIAPAAHAATVTLGQHLSPISGTA